ncbi:MAG TPA: G1 family glutamic endopeptidase [Acidimicrobiales bacterium]|nr:G1 family glutamic endopeptidase [Acidimicrobiales bacterium]
MWRRLLPLAQVGALTCLAIAAMIVSIGTEGRTVGAHRHSASPRLPIGSPQYGFGGYQLYPSKPVTSVSGEWTVPRIARTSGPGDASTWIGAQADNGAFAQVGTVENRFTHDQYYAFWSTTAKQFVPLYLLAVKPGDDVKARMKMTTDGWVLTLSDLTSGASKTERSGYGSHDTFNSCEWFQENPVYSQFVHTEYPSLSTVSFRNMKMNDSIPRFSYADAQTLSTSNDSFYVPTHVHRDRFTLVPAQGSALAFLIDVYLSDELGSEFFETATQGIEPGNVVTNTYIAGLGLDVPILKSQSWPHHVAGAMRHYIKTEEHLETYMQTWMDEPPAERSGNLANVQYQLFNADHVANKVRALLGLPPIYG